MVETPWEAEAAARARTALATAAAAFEDQRFDEVLAALASIEPGQLSRIEAAQAEALHCRAAFRCGRTAEAADRALVMLGQADPGIETALPLRFDVLALGATAAGELARFDQALAHLRELLALARRLGSLAHWVRARGTAANTFALLGDPWAAQRILAELAGSFQGSSGQLRLEATVRGNHASTCLVLARAAREGGDERAGQDALEQAEASVARGEEIALAMGDPRVLAFVRVHQAELALLRGRGAEALPMLDGALPEARQRGLEAHVRQLTLLQAELLMAAGRAAEADAALAAMAVRLTEGHELAVRIRHAQLQHEAAVLQGHTARAVETLRAAHRLMALRHHRQAEAQSRFLRTRLELEHLYRLRPAAAG